MRKAPSSRPTAAPVTARLKSTLTSRERSARIERGILYGGDLAGEPEGDAVPVGAGPEERAAALAGEVVVLPGPRARRDALEHLLLRHRPKRPAAAHAARLAPSQLQLAEDRAELRDGAVRGGHPEDVHASVANA